MDEQRLTEIDAAHEPLDGERQWCYACDRPSPCDALLLVKEVRRLREACSSIADLSQSWTQVDCERIARAALAGISCEMCRGNPMARHHDEGCPNT